MEKFKNITPPPVEYNDIDLPGTTLRYIKTGTGPPLIIVPAFVSRIFQWAPMAQFMGQKFTTYFFELPGHGDSTPYPEKFHTHLVPKTIETFADKLDIDRFALMGLSFGGLLGMHTLDYLLPRIDQYIMFCPALSHRALLLSKSKQDFLKLLFNFMRKENVQQKTIDFINHDLTFDFAATYISKFMGIDKDILVEKRLKEIPQKTLDVIAESLNEILSLEYDSPNKPFNVPCFFGMSQYDDLLDYDVTIDIVKGLFSNLHIEKFDLPYHQPPTPFTFEDYNSKFGKFLSNIDKYSLKNIDLT